MGIALDGTDRDRLTRIFRGLSEGATNKKPLTKRSWDSEHGWLADTFEITWAVRIDTS